MAPTTEDNVTPIRELDEHAALAWLRAQPGGRTNLSDAELGRRWGWNRKRAGRRVRAWVRDGLVTRRGTVTTAVPPGPDDKGVPPPEGRLGTGTRVDLVPPPDQPFVPSLVPPSVPALVPPFVPAPDHLQRPATATENGVAVGRSLAVRNAAVTLLLHLLQARRTVTLRGS
jgi:hypothetical protein